jgi:hypothetical protein
VEQEQDKEEVVPELGKVGEVPVLDMAAEALVPDMAAEVQAQGMEQLQRFCLQRPPCLSRVQLRHKEPTREEAHR